jgi:hypothetical protein
MNVNYKEDVCIFLMHNQIWLFNLMLCACHSSWSCCSCQWVCIFSTFEQMNSHYLWLMLHLSLLNIQKISYLLSSWKVDFFEEVFVLLVMDYMLLVLLYVFQFAGTEYIVPNPFSSLPTPSDIWEDAQFPCEYRAFGILWSIVSL